MAKTTVTAHRNSIPREEVESKFVGSLIHTSFESDTPSNLHKNKTGKQTYQQVSPRLVERKRERMLTAVFASWSDAFDILPVIHMAT